jgi:hypothetical protein
MDGYNAYSLHGRVRSEDDALMFASPLLIATRVMCLIRLFALIAQPCLWNHGMNNYGVRGATVL